MTAAKPKPRHSHIFAPESASWYCEPEWCSRRLFAVETFPQPVLDPSAGAGRVPDAAKAAGYQVLAADLVDRGYRGCKIQDFLRRRRMPARSVVCNPPFDLAEQFAKHALCLGAEKVALIFPSARLHAAHWIHDMPLRRVWLMTPRPSMPPGQLILRGEKPGGGRVDFCWTIFVVGHVGPPELRWLHRDDTGGRQ